MTEDIVSEERLRTGLAARAANAMTAPDWDDLAARIRRGSRRRTRAAVAAGGVLAIAAAALGFAIGSAHDETDPGVDVQAVAPSTSVGSTPVPVVPRPADETEGFAASSTGAPRVNGADIRVGSAGVPLGRVFVRTTSDGITVRGYRADYPPYDDGNPFWDAPGWCFPSGVLQADVSTDAIAAAVQGLTYATVRDGDLAATLSVIGVDEGAPVWVATVQAPDGTDMVRATFPGGGTDQMAPEQGVVALASPAKGDADADTPVRVEALVAGAVVASQSVTVQNSWFAMGGSTVELVGPGADGCAVPAVTLPPPGEQPTDPAAARAGVITAVENAYNGSLPDEQRAASIDDPDQSLAPIRAELASGPFADAVKSARADVVDLVFDTPTHAWVQYDIVTNISTFSARFGEAVFVDGVWKLSESTVCHDVALAGVSC
jgi:hypothetical protein